MPQYLPVQWQERNLGGAQCLDWTYIDHGPVGVPDANARLYDLLNEQNQRAGHFIIAPTFATTHSGGWGVVNHHCIASTSATGGATSVNSQATSTPIGMTNTATAYCRF